MPDEIALTYTAFREDSEEVDRYRSEHKDKPKSVADIIASYPRLVSRIAAREKISDIEAAIIIRDAADKTVREYGPDYSL